jgi:long-chain acyl-CoA synthetase
MFRTEKPWVHVYEGHVSPETEVFEGSLPDFFRSSVEEHRDKTAMTFYGTAFDFARLEALAEKMAASLAARGVKKGDRVALMLPNCPQYVASFFATVRLGAIVTQINPMYVEREIEHILKDSGAETIIVYSDMYPRVKNVMGETALKNVVVVDLKGEPEGLEPGHSSFGEFIGADVEPAPRVAIDAAEDVAVFQYTGGTTGVSKGAMLTHRNLVANVQQTLDLFVDDPAAFSNNQSIVAILPFFHIYGLTCVMLFGIRQGLNQLLLPRFDPLEVMNLVRDDEPVLFAGVPTMYMALNSLGVDLKEYGFDKVRTYNSGGSALPVNLKRSLRAEDRTDSVRGLRALRGVSGYALQPAVRGGEPRGEHRRPPYRARTRGSWDVGTGAQELPVGEPGELVIKGPQVMKGYWNMPEETEDT